MKGSNGIVRNPIVHRKYAVRSSNTILHTDANHNLITYKFSIFRIINSFSRILVLLYIANKNLFEINYCLLRSLFI